jgi:hypothetical protein
MSTATPSRPKVSLVKKTEAKAPTAEATVAVAAAKRQSDGLALVFARNEFYVRNSKRMLVVVFSQAILIIILILLYSSLGNYLSSRDYFFPVRNDNTRIIEKSLADPIYTDAQIIEWSEKAVTRTLTFGYYDHALRLQESRNFFTTKGWATFNQALMSAQILERMNALQSETVKGRNKVLIASIKPGTRAVIRQKGVLGWSHSWQVELQVNAAYKEKDRETGESWRVVILIVRTPFMDSRDGIGIDQIVATKASQ